MSKLFTVFHTFEDVSTEYKLKKIKYDADEFARFCSELSPTVVKFTCVGFMGAWELVSEACGQYLHLTNEEIQQLSASFINMSDSSTTASTTAVECPHESLLLIKKDSQIAFIYNQSDQIFKVGPLSSTALAIDYIRYMLDVCEKIIILPSNDIIYDTMIANPFQDSANTAVHVQERSVRPNETITITLLNDAQPFSLPNYHSSCNKTSDICHSQVRMTHDHTRFLYTLHVHSDVDITKKQVIVSTQDLENTNSYFQKSKLLDYEKAIHIVRTTWNKPDLFGTLRDRALKVFHSFVPDEQTAKFIQFIESIQEQYRSMIATKLTTANHLCAEQIYERSNEYSCMKRVMNGNVGFVSDVKEIFGFGDVSNPEESATLGHAMQTEKCSDSCRTVENILKSVSMSCLSSDHIDELQSSLKEISSSSLQIKIHKDRANRFYDDVKKVWQKHMRKRMDYITDELEEARQALIDQLILWLSDHTQRTTKTLRFDLDLTFYEINPIANIEANITDFKLNRKGFELKLRETGSIDYVQLSQVLFLSEKVGYFCLANFPSEKSSLYYFNFTQPPYVELSQRLSSSWSKLIVDERSNIYFIYDNAHQRAERGKLDERTRRLQATTPVDNLFNNTIEDLVGEDGEPKVLKHIEKACFLYGSDAILILDGEFNLIEYRYMTGMLKFVCRRVNEDTHVKKIELRPNNDEASKYVSIDVIPTGKCILLQCTTSVDIYDLTWTKIGSIPITEPTLFDGFKSFADQTNTYVALINNRSVATVYLLRGLSTTRTLDIQRTILEQIKGFPLLDIFYLAQRKFGPPSDYIGCPRKTQIVFLLPETLAVSSDRLDAYFTQLFTISMNLEIEPFADEPEWRMIFRKLPQISFNDIKRIIESRVPIHVATIEESNMFPLQDGRNITNDIALWKISNSNTTSLIQCITELIRLGSYEQLLTNCDQPLKVIAIVGRQSGGKSYLLNRVTGTRFNVASTRCTDGIWLSIAYLHGQPVVVLDCEGLFSTRRNDLEEIKLCLTLAALTDILFLNQDLSFNRYLTQLFSNFAKSCDRIKGSQLFKGFLMMAIRDVSSQDAEGAYIELISNIRQQAANNRSGYLEKLFGGKIVGHCIHHFENRIFGTEVDSIRQMIVDLPFRWNTGREFLESLKLTLAQVHTDDDTVMDVHRLKMAFARLEREAHTMIMQGGKQFSTCDKVTIQVKRLTKPDVDDEILIDQQQLNFHNDETSSDLGFTDLDSSGAEDSSRWTMKFVDLLTEFFKCGYKEEYHNIWFTNISQMQTIILEHRVAFIMSYIHSQLTTDPTYTADIKDFEKNLKTKLTEFVQSTRLCLRSCHQCRRLCIGKFDHRDDCSCETDHICKEPCELCSKSNLCCQLYGHEGKHRCNSGHACGKQCSVTLTCTLFCSLEIDHDDQEKHDCKNRHYCAQKCSQNPTCDKNCVFDASVDHSEHVCGETVCPHPCQISGCRQRCIFPNHAHQRLIDESHVDRLELDSQTINYHVCGTEHTCGHECVQKGVCSIGYDIIEKEWRNAMNTFPYKYYEPKSAKSKCVLPVPLRTLTHLGQPHNCKIEHRCGNQCPECRSFCQLPHGHSSPYHHTNAHRNKECNIFVSKHNKEKSITVKSEGRSHEYKVGDSCTPEICSESCERRGRSHFHLKLCPGDDKCAGKLYKEAKHSYDSWYPHQDKKYDIWLCEAYWHSLGWNVPYNDDVLATIRLCSFVCAHPSHIDDSSSFCTKTAWHTDEHTFTCKHDSFDKLDIVFCCDATGSMNSYIDESKKTVQRIIEASKAIKDVKFRFVAYRDHPPQDDSFITQSNAENLSDSAAVISFISHLTAEGGGDGPEAVLDGLNDAASKSGWRDASSLKYIVHIADAPPHGTQYTGGSGDHWPAGCPCGLTIEGISDIINSKKIRYKLMKIGTYPNTMASVFKTHIKNYEETDLNGALDLSVKFVGILARDLQTEEIDLIA